MFRILYASKNVCFKIYNTDTFAFGESPSGSAKYRIIRSADCRIRQRSDHKSTQDKDVRALLILLMTRYIYIYIIGGNEWNQIYIHVTLHTTLNCCTTNQPTNPKLMRLTSGFPCQTGLMPFNCLLASFALRNVNVPYLQLEGCRDIKRKSGKRTGRPMFEAS